MSDMPHLDKFLALAGEGFSSETPGLHRAYSRMEHGRVERVRSYQGAVHESMLQHLLHEHPGVYAYQQEGRSLSDLAAMHEEDHFRHVHMDHPVQTPDEIHAGLEPADEDAYQGVRERGHGYYGSTGKPHDDGSAPHWGGGGIRPGENMSQYADRVHPMREP